MINSLWLNYGYTVHRMNPFSLALKDPFLGRLSSPFEVLVPHPVRLSTHSCHLGCSTCKLESIALQCWREPVMKLCPGILVYCRDQEINTFGLLKACWDRNDNCKVGMGLGTTRG